MAGLPLNDPVAFRATLLRLYACPRDVSGQRMTNKSLRERLDLRNRVATGVTVGPSCQASNDRNVTERVGSRGSGTLELDLHIWLRHRRCSQVSQAAWPLAPWLRTHRSRHGSTPCRGSTTCRWLTSSLRQEGPEHLLGNFTGFLQADAYKGYDQFFVPGSLAATVARATASHERIAASACRKHHRDLGLACASTTPKSIVASRSLACAT